MELFAYEGAIRVSLEEENDLIVHEWFEYNPESGDRIIREILDRIYESFLEQRLTKVLVITNKAKGVFSPDMQHFINDVQFPRLTKDTPLKYVATVVNQNEFDKLGTKLWEDRLEQDDGMIVREFLSEEDGRAWLAQADR